MLPYSSDKYLLHFILIIIFNIQPYSWKGSWNVRFFQNTVLYLSLSRLSGSVLRSSERSTKSTKVCISPVIVVALKIKFKKSYQAHRIMYLKYFPADLSYRDHCIITIENECIQVKMNYVFANSGVKWSF